MMISVRFTQLSRSIPPTLGQAQAVQDMIQVCMKNNKKQAQLLVQIRNLRNLSPEEERNASVDLSAIINNPLINAK